MLLNISSNSPGLSRSYEGLPGGLCTLPKFPSVPMFPHFFLICSPITYLLTTFLYHQKQQLIVPTFPEADTRPFVPYDNFSLFP